MPNDFPTETLLNHLPKKRDLLIEYLHIIHDKYQHLSRAHLTWVADYLRLSFAEVYETASFYAHFQLAEAAEIPENKTIIAVCSSLPCALYGAKDLYADLKQHCQNEVRIKQVACLGRCAHAPVAVVGDNQIDYANSDMVKNAIQQGDTQAKPIENYIDYQTYLNKGGYQVFKNCVYNKNPQAIIDILQDADLRGLGGAGFPAYLKWQAVYSQPGSKYLAVNIDESEVATFKDRYYLETNPHQFIEGALIAATVIQADDIYLYLRNEYVSARVMLLAELAKLKKQTALKLPNIHLRRGAGMYICGEESAMIESIEGKRGLPRLKPPRISEKGLFGLPTLEHNLETLHWLPEIISKGAAWYINLGKEGFTGMRSFSVSGRVNKPGVYVVPTGTCLSELIENYCGGMKVGHQLKAFFVGGSCGGILPASIAHEALDFGVLEKYNCFIGSMAITILSDQDNIKQATLNAVGFLHDESCGQCTPCRVGSGKVMHLLAQKNPDTVLIEKLCSTLVDASICGLGQSIPNPVRCLIKYFPQELND